MKKKLGQILLVAPVFASLTTKHYGNFYLSYQIAKAAKELDQHRNFYVNEERKIVETYAIKDEKTKQVKIIDGNQISFKNQDDAIAFNKEINELHNMEVEVFEPFEIKVSDLTKGDANLTPQEILLLEDFVEFIDDEHNDAKEA